MLDMISNFLTTVDDFVWGIPLIVLILATGLFLTARLRFLQITKLPHAIKHLIANEKSGEDGEVSSFAALCTALSATIGTGNIVGVATAIVAGGPGALFWMWIAALVGTATKYSECLLAVKYRVVAEDGHIIGGPFYYIENGMGKRTSISEFTCQNRGGKGVKCYKIVEKTGDVVGAKAVNDDNEIMMITTEGIIIQLRVQDISTLSRITSGVKLINLDEGVKVAQIAKVREKLSNGDHEFDNLEEAMEEVAQEAVSEDEEEAEENLIFPTEENEDDE